MKSEEKVLQNFRNFVISRLSRSLASQEFVDVAVRGRNGDEIGAHRVVLAALSPFLSGIFQSVNEDEIVVIMPDVEADTIRQFVGLAYGRLSPESSGLDRENVDALCRLINLKHEPKNPDDGGHLVIKPGPESNPQSGGETFAFCCEICFKPFARETSLRHHKMAAHNNGVKEKLECEKCRRFFSGKSALLRHATYCDGKSTLDCRICGKIFARKDILVTHMTRHSGTKLKCEFCPKSFRTSNDLYKHKKRLHARASGLTDAYSVRCELCPRKFTDKGRAFQDHMDYHGGRKNYECALCDGRFASASALREHASKHAGRYTHECALCGKQFRRVQNARQHIISTHKLASGGHSVAANIKRLFLTGVDKFKANASECQDIL